MRFKCRISDVIDFKKDGINVADLCRYVGISRTSFYNIINNKCVPDVYKAILITEYLNDCLVQLGYQADIYDISDYFKITS